MTWRRLIGVGLLLGHLAIALTLILILVGKRHEADALRQQERTTAARERRETEVLQHQVDSLEAIKDGLRHDDPYVVEMMARRLHQYQISGEITPPPLSPVEVSST